MKEKHLPISKRLKTIATYLSQGSYFLDVGSDHAYLPCYVCQHDHKAQAIAGEINEGPFYSAKQTVEKYGLSNRIDVRLGDGLDVLNDSDAPFELVIAGMGGTLIKKILGRGHQLLTHFKRIIVQPNIDERDARIALLRLGYTITHEHLIKENGHIYEIIVADFINSKEMEKWAEKDLLLGRQLQFERHPLFIEKWQSEHRARARILSQMKRAKKKNDEKMARFERELSWIEEVLDYE
ncbi:MAG TPA: tRNA (adenine(22)-N(1))-methyltransferase TrmK [Cerasibacillus sp.]|uniref:tRNA (adenine(22)-N(1))-methyltransferase n=1 Tax=Cerasibacillus sp. TaxID=2498711 RepID=UPI002F420D6C